MACYRPRTVNNHVLIYNGPATLKIETRQRTTLSTYMRILRILAVVVAVALPDVRKYWLTLFTRARPLQKHKNQILHSTIV